MGHTTRCVPIVRHLQSCGHTVILAGNEQQRAYWKALFPDLLTLPLQGYRVLYGRRGLRLSVLLQLPKMMRAIRAEHRWLLKVVKEYRIDGVISDNRYGLHHPGISSVIMTHQLRVLSGAGHFADTILQKLHYTLLNRFGACWVPDAEGADNLAGMLSHPERCPRNTKYIGLLSALAPPVARAEQHILILLSGPEPQRSMLSQQLWIDAHAGDRQIVFVEGSISAPVRQNIPAHICWYAQLSGAALQTALEAASQVICRSGYSTLMDLALLRKKAVLIPTPGQTEQEYLAAYLLGSRPGISFAQKDFSIAKASEALQHFDFSTSALHDAHMRFTDVVDNWVETL